MTPRRAWLGSAVVISLISSCDRLVERFELPVPRVDWLSPVAAETLVEPGPTVHVALTAHDCQRVASWKVWSRARPDDPTELPSSGATEAAGDVRWERLLPPSVEGLDAPLTVSLQAQAVCADYGQVATSDALELAVQLVREASRLPSIVRELDPGPGVDGVVALGDSSLSLLPSEARAPLSMRVPMGRGLIRSVADHWYAWTPCGDAACLTTSSVLLHLDVERWSVSESLLLPAPLQELGAGENDDELSAFVGVEPARRLTLSQTLISRADSTFGFLPLHQPIPVGTTRRFLGVTAGAVADVSVVFLDAQGQVTSEPTGYTLPQLTSDGDPRWVAVSPARSQVAVLLPQGEGLHVFTLATARHVTCDAPDAQWRTILFRSEREVLLVSEAHVELRSLDDCTTGWRFESAAQLTSAAIDSRGRLTVLTGPAGLIRLDTSGQVLDQRPGLPGSPSTSNVLLTHDGRWVHAALGSVVVTRTWPDRP